MTRTLRSRQTFAGIPLRAEKGKGTGEGYSESYRESV